MPAKGRASFREYRLSRLKTIRILAIETSCDETAAAVVERDVHGMAHIRSNIVFGQMQEHEAAFDAHLEIENGRWGQADAIKAEVKAMLTGEFGIGHSTLETECSVHSCDRRELLQHG